MHGVTEVLHGVTEVWYTVLQGFATRCYRGFAKVHTRCYRGFYTVFDRGLTRGFRCFMTFLGVLPLRAEPTGLLGNSG